MIKEDIKSLLSEVHKNASIIKTNYRKVLNSKVISIKTYKEMKKFDNEIKDTLNTIIFDNEEPTIDWMLSKIADTNTDTDNNKRG